MRYASGEPSRDSDVLLYHLCSTFGCLPSHLEAEDPKVIAKMAYINYIVESKLKSDAKKDRS